MRKKKEVKKSYDERVKEKIKIADDLAVSKKQNEQNKLMHTEKNNQIKELEEDMLKIELNRIKI